ncbi:DUF3560 domain-containing protein [Rhodococcus sp. G-MC3]|uniref:DUF3560 domain-containing protein n=1 Tax=Rhodococcus sp. G-MC3 TaxID=3046209 RepID=UPI0024BBE9F7|nr:DUF3560 domain-containing protein [Rhodococcus sp. G-MC3]MDJ0396497.1 DUF3560 domain-containing protein [Rhodococcus sp. G-MC3]
MDTSSTLTPRSTAPKGDDMDTSSTLTPRTAVWARDRRGDVVAGNVLQDSSPAGIPPSSHRLQHRTPPDRRHLGSARAPRRVASALTAPPAATSPERRNPSACSPSPTPPKPEPSSAAPAKGDGTNVILKAYGWRWFASLITWGIRGSRDRPPQRRIIDATAAALRTAGFDVELDIDTTARPAALVESDRAERQTDRVAALAALGAKAERRSERADAAWEAEQRAVAALPPAGEPIKIGHHSEGRHRHAIDKAYNATRKAIAATDAAK